MMSKFNLFNDEKIIAQKPDLRSIPDDNKLMEIIEEQFIKIENQDMDVTDVIIDRRVIDLINNDIMFKKFVSPRVLKEGKIGKLYTSTVWVSPNKVSGWIRAFGKNDPEMNDIKKLIKHK